MDFSAQLSALGLLEGSDSDSDSNVIQSGIIETETDIVNYESSSEDDAEIRRKALEDVIDPTGTKFLELAEEGNVEGMREMLEENPKLIKYHDSDKYTALHRAAYSEKPDALTFLIDSKADVQLKTLDGWTPLHSASKWNSSKCVKILLDRGADVNAKSNGGLTPLHIAAENPVARETLILLLLHPNVDPYVKTPTGETGEVIAAQHGPLSYLFELVRNAISSI